jgi:hypothetical protein
MVAQAQAMPTESVGAPAAPATAGDAAATAPAPAPAPAPASAPTPAAAAAPAGAPAKGADLKALSFFSQRYSFRWDTTLAITGEVDGLKINNIFFNKRTIGLLKGAEFGTRAVVNVTNTANATRTPGFAVAVFDAQDRLVGVATGGPKIGGVSAGETEDFDLSFHQVLDRIPNADHFYLSIELSN